jgi:dihydroorotate dehydrogenase (NAD+) catalytic subunit
VEAYARVGFDILTYATVRSSFRPAYGLPNIRPVESRDQAAIARRGGVVNGGMTIAVSTGMPSMEPDIWRRDIRRAKDRLGPGQVLVVSVVGTPMIAGDYDSLIADYARCGAWAAEAGADAIEAHLACPDPYSEQVRMVYENVPLAAHILHRMRTTISVPVIAKLGVFRTPRLLHETLNKLAPWASAIGMVHGLPRRVVDEDGQAIFEGPGREPPNIVGADTFPVASRQIAELLSWRKAGAWDRLVLAAGGLTTVERAEMMLREGADVVLVATAALFDPLFAVRFRQVSGVSAA